MAHFNFIIPSKKEALLTETTGYCVENVVVLKDMARCLETAKQSFRDEGVECILDHFPVFYSVLHHGNSLPMDITFKSYQNLYKAINDLNKALGFLLEDKSSINDELQQKYQNVMKMLVYVYTEIVLLIENINTLKAKSQVVLKSRGKKANDQFTFNLDKKNILLSLNNIIQRDIGIFWDPPVVEESFLNMITEVCYKFLQNPLVKGEKDVREEIFNIIGTLIKSYNHGTVFAIRMTQMVKCEEHLIQCFSEGIKQLVDQFNCKGLIHYLIMEITEWQTDEQFQDSQGSRFCAQLLTSMAGLMPDLMIPELLYLNKYLNHESATLRSSVLNVITEVILNVLTKHNLSEEETESRDDFLTILMDHIDDVSAHVRCKVIQHWARLQKEVAVPRKLVGEILEKIIDHLEDKAAIVRKSAASCITTFLVSNTFGAELSLAKMKIQLEDKEKAFSSIKSVVEQIQMSKIIKLEAKWDSMVLDLKKVIEEELQKDDDSDQEDDETNVNKEERNKIGDTIKVYLEEGKYKEAFHLAKTSGTHDKEFEKYRKEHKPDEIDLYMFLLKTIFINPLKLLESMKHGIVVNGLQVTEEDFQKFELLQENVEYLQEVVTFLELIDGAIETMIELMETTTISDMQEAVEFFTSAYQFNIDNADRGIMAMLQIMKRSEQDRKDIVIGAFKLIYLKTDSTNMLDHCTTVVNRLIRFLKSVPTDNIPELELIIIEWISKGVLDNSIIDMLWQYFTRKTSVSDEDCHASVELLRMAALGRKTIIIRNIKLVATIGFNDITHKNLAFLGSICELLSVAGRDRIAVTSKDLPFRIKIEDEIFKNLFDILLEKFFEPVEFYYKALSGAIDFVYKLCNKPEKFCEDFISKIIEKLFPNHGEPNEIPLDRFIYMRLCQLLGLVAIKQLDYLDDTVYKELKRREHVRNELKVGKTQKTQNKKKPPVRASVTPRRLEQSSVTDSNQTIEEPSLEGAQAEDEDAEFILRVLEKDTVSGSGGLGKLAYLIQEVCRMPDVYNDVMLQGAAVTALIRYMLVSAEFCQQNIQLLFTIFEKAESPEIKVSILVHLSDLLSRFPNIIEPWISRIYDKLKHPRNDIRKATFFTLSSLILRDMVRAHCYISQMVTCLVDEDQELQSMSRTFFVTLSHKEHNLYNVLPDIFSHLMEAKEIAEENIRDMMKFLFELMGKAKYMENLVDRFCAKFLLSEDVRHHRNIAYCLSLIVYNEKALRKLHENFSSYKHLVHDSEIYASFKSILQGCNKQQVTKVDLKPIVAEIEKSINSVFELNQDDKMMRPPFPPKSARKQKQPSDEKQKRKHSRKQSDSDNERFSSSSSISDTPARKSNRKRKERKVVDYDYSD